MEAPVVTNFIRNKCHINDATLPYLEGWDNSVRDQTPVVMIDVRVGADCTRTKNVFYLNSIQQPRLILHRRTKYNLIVNTPGHPFYFSSDAGGMNPLTQPSESLNIVLTPENTVKFPSTFYYHCKLHKGMGGVGNMRS